MLGLEAVPFIKWPSVPRVRVVQGAGKAVQAEQAAGKAVAGSSIKLTISRFGHSFINHGEEATKFIINRARGSGIMQGQFLDNQKAAQFILANVSKTANGPINLPLPKNIPARVIMPDGTFTKATHIRLIPGGKGVKTAYPVILP